MHTRDGETHVWTTFSPDQVDLNWQNPDVLFEFLDILLLYLSHGVKILRLDAVAFLWKELGTNCLHLPQTHEVVKLLRDVCEMVAPETLILTETNVPHDENISYFGQGDEAHMVYNFSLPPLLLHALLSGDGTHLTAWARDLIYPEGACTYFNFTASHDGVGVRPVQGLLPQVAFDFMVDQVKQRGGHVSMKTNADGSQSPYELNITYASALSDPDDEALGLARFLCSQALALALKGVPAVYLHSLLGTPNDSEAAESTGIPRRINRRKYQREELDQLLAEEGSQNTIFRRMQQMLRRRANQPAFHPEAGQTIHDAGASFFVFERTSISKNQVILCAFNLTGEAQTLQHPWGLKPAGGSYKAHDILSGKAMTLSKKGLMLKPYQAVWLVAR